MNNTHVGLYDETDVNIPNAARAYDYFVRDAHNHASDRRGRALHFMIGSGIQQFIDIPSGIPTAGNVRQTAQTIVDNAPVAVAHGSALLAGNRLVTTIQADTHWSPGNFSEEAEAHAVCYDGAGRKP